MSEVHSSHNSYSWPWEEVAWMKPYSSEKLANILRGTRVYWDRGYWEPLSKMTIIRENYTITIIQLHTIIQFRNNSVFMYNVYRL